MKTTFKTNQVDHNDLEIKVKNMYREVALYPDHDFHFMMGRDLAMSLGYPVDHLNKIPKDSIESFAGVGYYFDLGNLRQGETVVDLGSGSGMDAFLAGVLVGNSGEVIGIDMTDEQLAKAKKLRDKGGHKNVKFIKSYIEKLPLDSSSTDVVISNGVINLSGNKEKVFIEANRILKPGGRLVISDIVSEVQLPESISCNATLWAACIGGAMQEDVYIETIKNAGFLIDKIQINNYEFISNNAKSAGKKYGIKSISLLAIKK
jgi:ubiquinone/menaquinone biosynthesis C-methylase UbiE